MSFYETQMGRAFFECHVPQLIKAVQDVAKVLSKPAPVMALSVKPEPEFLSELYHGSYEPETFKLTPEGSLHTQEINAAHEDLLAVLTQEGQEKLIKYQDALAEHNSAEMERAYESGFRTAVQMMGAGLSQPAAGQTDDVA